MHEETLILTSTMESLYFQNTPLWSNLPNLYKLWPRPLYIVGPPIHYLGLIYPKCDLELLSLWTLQLIKSSAAYTTITWKGNFSWWSMRPWIMKCEYSYADAQSTLAMLRVYVQLQSDTEMTWSESTSATRNGEMGRVLDLWDDFCLPMVNCHRIFMLYAWMKNPQG